MGRRSIPEELEERIKQTWTEDKTQTADQVWKEVRVLNQHGGWYPSIRKVQMVIREAKEEDKPIPDDPELEPWGQGWPQNSDDIACLLRLKVQSFQHPEMPLTTRVGKWALRLRSVFQGRTDDPTIDIDFELLYWAYEYTLRERASDALGLKMYTADLDGVMMLRPWGSAERLGEYQRAVVSSLVPYHRVARLAEHMVLAASAGWEEVVRCISRSAHLSVIAESNEALSDRSRSAARKSRLQFEELLTEVRAQLKEAGPPDTWDRNIGCVVNRVLERVDGAVSGSLLKEAQDRE